MQQTRGKLGWPFLATSALLSCWLIATRSLKTPRRSSPWGPTAAPPVLMISWCLCSDFLFLFDTGPPLIYSQVLTVSNLSVGRLGQTLSARAGWNCPGWGGSSRGRSRPVYLVYLPVALPWITYAGAVQPSCPKFGVAPKIV